MVYLLFILFSVNIKPPRHRFGFSLAWGWQFELLVKHSIDKHGEAPGIKCGQCGKGFIDNTMLDKHVSEEHNCKQPKKDYQCSLCQKVIRTQLGVERHAELFCEECRKCSSERTSFNNHMGVFHKPSSDSSQTKVKNDLYICERCEKTYEGLQELNNHFCDPRPAQSIHCEQCPYVTM